LGALLRVAWVVTIAAAVVVDAWLLRSSSSSDAYVLVAGVGVVGAVAAAIPRSAAAAAPVAAGLSLLATLSTWRDFGRFALFTELVVLPVLFAAVLARRTRHRWPAAASLAVAAAAAGARSDAAPIRAIIAMSMIVVFGVATSAVVYMRLRDQQRETSIEQARQSERLDLARELHDVVGHHVTGIVVLAQATRFSNADDRTGTDTHADWALAQIEAAGLQTLTSVRRLIGLLRTDSALSPPSIGDVELVVDDLRTTHPSTELIVDPELRERWLPADLAVTMERLIREAATNVRRHGDPAAPVLVTIRRAGDTVTLTVENTALRATVGAGYGVLGMQERVSALHGSFSAEPDRHGRWLVRVELPLLRAAE
jgi:signal transduction histidine kinase